MLVFQAQQESASCQSQNVVKSPVSLTSSNSLPVTEASTPSSAKADCKANGSFIGTKANNSRKAVDEEHERLTFHIALGDGGFASLGISVKKLTVGRKDLGIFIKSVLIGGTAAKVCEF
jgi:hypothetical protein